MEKSTGKTALVTGASSGIGAVYAGALAALGYDLVLVARRPERLEELATALQAAHGVQAEVLSADLTDPAGLACVEARIRELDTLDFVVNSAGFGTAGRFYKVDLETHVKMIELHVLAAVRITHSALPIMLARRSGFIVNVASIAAFVNLPGTVTYNATKAFLVAFSENLQADLWRQGIWVQALCPGFTRTEFHSTELLSRFNPRIIPWLLWSSSEEVVRASLVDLWQGKTVSIPGRINQVLVGLARNRLTGPVLRGGMQLMFR